jgi:hypothetical protein
MRASRRLFLLSSVVWYRRLPNQCENELIVNVPCHRSVVDTKHPHTRAGQLPMSQRITPNAMPGTR